VKHVSLSQGAFAIVDDNDFLTVSRFNWHLKKDARKTSYAVRNNKRGLSPALIKMHRVIAEANPGQIVDHVNGNGLDNRRRNLRIATPSLNQANRRVAIGRHGVKGVHYIPYTQNKGKRWDRAKPWKAEITVSRRTISIGYFKTKDEAAAAYDVAAKRYFGEFAATNADLGLR